MERRLWIAGLAAGAATLALPGCGGGLEDRTKARVRFVNASSGYAALDLWVDDERRLASVAYGQSADYLELDPAADRIDTDVTRPGSASPLVSLVPAVAKRDYYTLLAYGAEGALKVAVLDENAGEPDSGKARLRVFNAAADAGSLDVYLTAATDPLADAVALQAGAAVGSETAYATLNAGTWRLRVTAAGAKADLRLDVGGLVLESRQVLTLVITPAAGGVLVDALLLVQEGAVVARANAQARVRVASGIPAGGSVSASVGGVALLNAAGSPAVGEYVLVPAGEQAVVVAVDGTVLATSPVTLPPGSDRTLLVHRPGDAPVASWMADDNRLPQASGKAKLRLVHGMAGTAAAMALTVDGLPVAGGLAAGAASAYSEVAPGTTVDLSATVAGTASPVYAVTDRTLVAGAVYTVFVLGGPTPASGVLRQDR